MKLKSSALVFASVVAIMTGMMIPEKPEEIKLEPKKVVKTEVVEEIEEDTVEETTPNWVSYGDFRITYYCPCSECSEQWGRQTSTGAVATAGRTIAVDPDVIPYGTTVMIDGNEYIAEDCGGAINNSDIDIFVDTHEETFEGGSHYSEVFVYVD